MIGILLSLVPLFAWGWGDYLASRYAKKINPFSASTFYGICGFCFSMIVVSFYPRPEFYMSQFLYALSSSILLNIGFLLMIKAFKHGPVGIVATIANAYAIITALVSFVFFNQHVGFGKFLGILIVIIGIALISYTKPNKKEHYDSFIYILLSIFALLFFGVGFSLFERASTQQWPQNMAVYQMCNILVSLTIWLLFQKKNKLSDMKYIAKDKLAYTGGVAGASGQIAMFAALKYIPNVAILAAIAAAAPLVTAALAYFFDKERLTLFQRMSTFVIVAGIILLSV